MSDNPMQLIVAAFQDEGAAKATLKGLKKAQKTKVIKIENTAVLRKDKKRQAAHQRDTRYGRR
jgi:uncharacterized membrane protein